MSENLSQTDRLMEVMERVYFQKNRPGLEHFLQGEMRVLTFVYRSGRVMLPGEIAAAMNMTGGRVAGILRSLEKKGYILRQTDEKDRRRVLVTITENGAECVKNGAAALRQSLSELCSIMGEEQTEQYISAMNAYLDAAAELWGRYERGR